MKIQTKAALIAGIATCTSTPRAVAAPNHERMVVTGTRSITSIDRIPASVQVLTDEQLQEIWAPGDTLGTVLATLVPGLGPATDSVSHFGQTMRGRSVLLVIDGIPQTENRKVSRQLNTIQTKAIARIEVIAGASAIYGPEASGGIIHIITKSPSPTFESTSGLGSSFAAQNLTDSTDLTGFQQISGQAGSLGYVADVFLAERGRSFDSNGELIAPEPAQTSATDTRTLDASLKFQYPINQYSELELSGRIFDELQDTDVIAVAEPNYDAVEDLKLSDQPQSQSRSFSLRLRTELAQNDVEAIVYNRSRTYRFFPFAINLAGPINVVNQSTSHSDTQGATLNINSYINDSLSLIWGIDFSRETGDQSAQSYDSQQYAISGGTTFSDPSDPYDYGPEVKTQTTAAFLQSMWSPTSSWHVQGGLRFETIRQTIEGFTPPFETAVASNWQQIVQLVQAGIASGSLPEAAANLVQGAFQSASQPSSSQSFQGSAFNLGVTFNLDSHRQLFINASQGYELADTARLLRDSLAPNSRLLSLQSLFQRQINASTADDIDLRTIQTSSIELGIRQRLSALSVGFTGFYNQSDKTYTFNPDFTVDLNDELKRIYGFDSHVTYKPSAPLALGASLSYTKGESELADGNGWQPLSPMEASPPKFSAFSSYKFRYDQNLRAQWTHVLASDSVATNTFATAPYSIVDLFYNLNWGQSHELALAVNNALNESYKSLFHQWAEVTYGATSGRPASGRRYSVQYSLHL